MKTVNNIQNPAYQLRNKHISVSFGAYNGTLKLKDKRYCRGYVKNYTELRRNPALFDFLPIFLKRKYPKGVNIYNYACANALESYSLIMSMENKLGKEKTKDFLPIKALDISKKAIKDAQSQNVILNKTDISNVKNLKNINISDYFLKSGKKFLVTPELFNKTEFEVADIFKDLDGKKDFTNPIVLFFRNAWQFLSENAQIELANKMFNKLPSESTVVIGELDYIVGVGDILINSGFKQYKNTYPQNYIFTKPKLNKMMV